MSRYELHDGTYSDNYKIGDRFVYTGPIDEANIYWTEEQLLGVFEFIFDDLSCCPKFRSEVDGTETYEGWCFLSKYHAPQQVIVETQPTELEEAYAHIETLESALEDVVKRLDNWRNGRNESYGLEDEDGEVKFAGNELQFKPISEMTLEDWELAKKHKWLFADNLGDESLLVQDIVNGEFYFSGYGYPFTVSGVHTEKPEEFQIIKRIK